MGHTIGLRDPQKFLDQETLQEFIDLFFDAKDSLFGIEVVPTYEKVPNPGIRGLCATNHDGAFRITLYPRNIQEHINRGSALGGNVTKARDLKLGLYLVLAHELRHAWQSVFHGKSSTLFKGKYKARAGEVDARRHVDENYDGICAFLGVEGERGVLPPGENPELTAYVDLLMERSIDGVVACSEDDVWDEVMSMSGDPDALFGAVQFGLRARGLRLG